MESKVLGGFAQEKAFEFSFFYIRLLLQEIGMVFLLPYFTNIKQQEGKQKSFFLGTIGK